jgi:CRISPR-associated protein Csb1
MSQLQALSFDTLHNAVAKGTALRAILRLQPAGGKGAKVFPSTYGPSQDGKDKDRFGETKYATEQRRLDGRTVDCVLLDSVASQANRFEIALRDAWGEGTLSFPLVRVDFSGADLVDPIGEVTTLDAPHRIYDAILRDSVDATGILFRHTEAGAQITAASSRDATALYRYCPTALIFGAWDSTGPKGGMGSKFPRAIASEIVAIDAVLGTRVSSRIDPLQISKVMDVAYKNDNGQDWSLEPNNKKSKSVAPSEINHGNVTPSRDQSNGGVTFDHARQTTVLSLPALRRLKFPTNVAGQPHANRPAAEHAARTALAALALAAIARVHAEGHDLRSGTLLVGEGPLTIEVLDGEGGVVEYALNEAAADALLAEANRRADAVSMGWSREPIPALKPAPKLVHLLQASQKQQLTRSADTDGDK